MNKIQAQDIKWKTVKYIKIPWQTTDENADWHYEFELPEPLASWDVFAVWEVERILSMEKHLNKGDVLFDIGTEQGWCNLAYAQMVGPENIVLIEPTREFWGNIKYTWQKNIDVEPKATLCALLSDKTTKGYKPQKSKVWCEESDVDWIIDRNKYQYIHANDEKIPEITIDDYVKHTGIIPSALTCDTEGSELLILKGAKNTLKKYKPKLFISIHPDMALRDYNIENNEIHDYLSSLGYIGEHLATDHEEHYFFEVK